MSLLFNTETQKNKDGDNENDSSNNANGDCTIEVVDDSPVTAKPEVIVVFFKMSLTCFHEANVD